MTTIPAGQANDLNINQTLTTNDASALGSDLIQQKYPDDRAREIAQTLAQREASLGFEHPNLVIDRITLDTMLALMRPLKDGASYDRSPFHLLQQEVHIVSNTSPLQPLPCKTAVDDLVPDFYDFTSSLRLPDNTITANKRQDALNNFKKGLKTFLSTAPEYAEHFPYLSRALDRFLSAASKIIQQQNGVPDYH